MPMATELISHISHALTPFLPPLENWSNFPIHRGFEMAGFSFAQADPPRWSDVWILRQKRFIFDSFSANAI